MDSSAKSRRVRSLYSCTALRTPSKSAPARVSDNAFSMRRAISGPADSESTT